jgi:1-acyl-sn-glycerol-3-phosphate acyltransferase
MEKIVRLFMLFLGKFFYRLEVTGLDNIPEKGGVILCSNHPGTFDMFFIACKVKRLVHYMAKEELFKNPILAYILSKLGAFPVKRGTADINSIKTALKLLKEGKILGILPEGTRTGFNTKRKIRPKAGAALIAVKANVPIVPAAISGDYRKLFSKVKVKFGKPFYINSEPDKKYTKDELEKISMSIMDKVYSLLEEE